MTKKQFITRISSMEHPVMEFFICDSLLMNLCCYVRDKENKRNKFQAAYVRMTKKEYKRGDIEAYNKREIKMRRTKEKWLHDVCGGYCTVLNHA
jgi:hypothetical protein